MKIALIPCAACEWRLAGRMLGRVELPPLDGATALLQKWIPPLRSLGLARIYYGPDELSAHTARLIGAEVGCPQKRDDALVEVDLGLWVGLTAEELEKRYASVYHQLSESALKVVPPGGEELSDARDRLRKAITARTRRSRSAAIGFVLRPVAFALTRSALGNLASDEIWPAVLAEDELAVMEPGKPVSPTSTIADTVQPASNTPRQAHG